MKKIILKMLTLILAFNITLLGNTVSEVVSSPKIETVEVSLDSFGMLSIVLIVGLTSLVGAYFVKDEFSSILD